MKTLSFPQLLFAGLGALLVWSAIKGQTPAQVIKDALSGTSSATTPAAAAEPLAPYVRPTGTVTGDARSNVYGEQSPNRNQI